MRSMTTLTRLFVPSALIVAAVAALSACGGGAAQGPQVASVPDGTASAASPPAGGGTDWMPFVRCLREHGLDVRDPDPDNPQGNVVTLADGGQIPVMDPAHRACASKMPALDEGPHWKPEEIEKLRQYAACMRENGATEFPDPDPETGDKPEDSTYNFKLDPKARKAGEACDHLYPQSESQGVAG